MNLPEFSVNRRITTFMLILIVVLFGVISFTRLGLDMMPDLEFPMVSIITTYEGVASADVENLVTKPIEEAASGVKRVKNVSSISREGISAVMVEFEWGTLLDFAAQDVRDRLSWLADILPEDADTPKVVKFNMSDFPILMCGVTGMENTIKLREYLKDNIKPRLERLDGVASAWIMGGLVREINVFIERDKLKAYGLSLDHVVKTLRLENLNISAGHVTKGYTEFLVRVMGEYKALDPIRNTVVAMHKGAPVYVKDIARVEDSHKEIRNYARLNKKNSILMMILKQSGANSVNVINSVNKTLKEMKDEIPEDVKFYPVMDHSDIIKKVVYRTSENALYGGVLAIIILLFFLRNWRPTIIIALAIPLSIITAFIGMYALGYTLNIMTMGGLALGIGMLVDNAVVVIENTFRHIEEGKDNKESAKIGANEVGMAITASTLTTVAVFLPMVLSSGVAGRLARPLSLTVCLALFSSLFVAITIVPMIASIILRNKRPAHHTTSSHEGGFDRARAYYKRLLLTSLKHKWKVVGGTILVFLASLGMVPILGTEFMPKQDTPFLFMLAKLPVGTALDETNKVIKKIEDEVIRQPEALYVSPFIGLSEATEMDVAWGTGAADVNEAQIMAKLVEKEERERSSDEVLEYIRTRLPKIEGATFNFVDMGEMMMGGGNQSPIEVKVFGKELSKLKDIADMIKARSEDIEGFRDVEVSLKTGKPELQIKVDRELASRLGLTVAQIGQAVKGAMLGIRTTMYRTGGDEYELRVRYQGFDRGSINDVENVTITSPLGSQVALYQVAKIEHGTGPLEITRENQERNVAVKGNTFGRDMGSIVGDIKKRLDQIELPKGYYVKYGGRYEDMEEAFASLAGALAIAIVLIYMVMAAQFESLAHPFIIMFTIPLAIIGVILGLFVFGKSLSVPSFMGVIILTGIVVNNGIVMIDYINQLRQRGVSGFDAIVEGATVRFRPVLITAITTILGMLPMALSQSQGAGMRAPMAIAVAFGLLVATILTLFVIPVLYSIMSRISYSKSA